jgi:C4-dicarboxylate-specific signal transduction histidine kinase
LPSTAPLPTNSERIFGMRPAVGESMLDLLALQRRSVGGQSGVGRALAGEEFAVVEEVRDPARDRCALRDTLQHLARSRDGKRIGAYQFVYDVTERLRDHERLKRAEEALRQAQKMESIGQLTGGVAHDFNNLLAVFANGLQLLERNVNQEQRQRVFEGMRRAIARGAGLTHHLLAFSRRRPVNPESIDLAAHLSGLREILDRHSAGHTRRDEVLAQTCGPWRSTLASSS